MAMKTGDAFKPRQLSDQLKESLPDVYVDDLLITLKYFIDEEEPEKDEVEEVDQKIIEHEPESEDEFFE